MGCDWFFLVRFKYFNLLSLDLLAQHIPVELSNRFTSGFHIPLIIAAFIFVPLYLNAKISTIPEFLGQRFDRRSIFFYCNYYNQYFGRNSGRLVRWSHCFKNIFPSIIIWQTTALAFFANIYSFWWVEGNTPIPYSRSHFGECCILTLYLKKWIFL